MDVPRMGSDTGRQEGLAEHALHGGCSRLLLVLHWGILYDRLPDTIALSIWRREIDVQHLDDTRRGGRSRWGEVPPISM